MIAPDDRALVRRAAGSDQDAFAHLVAHWSPRLYRVARARGLCPADAEAVVREIPLQAGRPEAYVYVRINLARLPAVRAWPAQWENGVGLLGYRAGQGNPLVMDYYLRVFREAEPGMDYHWFNHLYDGDRKFAALDGGGIHPANWRAGDVLLHRFAIPLPDDAPAPPYRLHMGAYRYPQLQNIMVLDAQGRPTTDHVTLNIE